MLSFTNHAILRCSNLPICQICLWITILAPVMDQLTHGNGWSGWTCGIWLVFYFCGHLSRVVYRSGLLLPYRVRVLPHQKIVIQPSEKYMEEGTCKLGINVMVMTFCLLYLYLACLWSDCGTQRSQETVKTHEYNYPLTLQWVCVCVCAHARMCQVLKRSMVLPS